VPVCFVATTSTAMSTIAVPWPYVGPVGPVPLFLKIQSDEEAKEGAQIGLAYCGRTAAASSVGEIRFHHPGQRRRCRGVGLVTQLLRTPPPGPWNAA
jgi:hypothetical protein